MEFPALRNPRNIWIISNQFTLSTMRFSRLAVLHPVALLVALHAPCQVDPQERHKLCIEAPGSSLDMWRDSACHAFAATLVLMDNRSSANIISKGMCTHTWLFHLTLTWCRVGHHAPWAALGSEWTHKIRWTTSATVQ